MARLQHDLADSNDVTLVSLTVDPEYDTPKVLSQYASTYGADPKRWLFLTGNPADVYRLIREGFKLTAQQNVGAERTPGNEVMHDTRLAVVDRAGEIRGYYQATEPQAVAELEKKIAALLREKPGETATGAIDFPSLNALLNGTCGLLLLAGYAAIRRRAVTFHKTCMLAALAVSIVFLTSYLYYHFALKGGRPTEFPGEGWLRNLYFSVLISHTILAAVVAPLALVTAYLGLTGRLARHVRLARWTLPIWLYVSVTGVVVYWMLYRLYPAS
jgi:protein SCO1/2/putative membrane protein